MKKQICTLLGLTMMVCLLGNTEPVMAAGPSAQDKTVQAEAQEPANGGSGASGTVTNSDGVTVSKTIEPTGIENYFDITLKVRETERLADTSTDIVIVMDISNTMNSDTDNEAPDVSKGETSRLTEAKLAAQKFITAPGFSSNRRFTNIEGGLRLAEQMLETCWKAQNSL